MPGFRCHFSREPKGLPKKMLMATDPCWMPTKKERPQGGVWASRDKQPVLQHSGNERHSTAKSSRHIPNILTAGGTAERRTPPGTWESRKRPPSSASSETDEMQPGASLHSAQQQSSHDPPHSPPPPEPAGCPGFNPTGSIIPIISLHFQSTSLHFQSTDLGAVHKSLHPESKAIYCFISSHLHFSNPWKQGRGLEHMGCPGGVCPADGGLGLLS